MTHLTNRCRLIIWPCCGASILQRPRLWYVLGSLNAERMACVYFLHRFIIVLVGCVDRAVVVLHAAVLYIPDVAWSYPLLAHTLRLLVNSLLQSHLYILLVAWSSHPVLLADMSSSDYGSISDFELADWQPLSLVAAAGSTARRASQRDNTALCSEQHASAMIALHEWKSQQCGQPFLFPQL